MAETAVISALGQMGAAGILALAVVSLFNRLTEVQKDFRQYLINQNAALQEQNKILLMTLTRLVPNLGEQVDLSNNGVVTKIDK